MSRAWQVFTSLLSLAIVISVFGWVFWRALKKSDDPGSLIRKWILTVLVLGGLFFVIPVALSSPYIGVPLAAACGVILSIIWAPSWAGMFSRPLTAVFDGGDEEPEAKPIYSIAENKRRKGQFREAVEHIRGELAKFPNDTQGQLLLAEIHAENLNDLATAQTIVERLVNQPGHTPGQVSGALQALADWHLKHGQDPDSARQALEKIINLLPETQFSQLASQRIAHLTSVNQLLESHERPVIALPHHNKHVGLLKSAADEPKPIEKAPGTFAAEYVAHLEKHPRDSEAREKLAVIYAEHYQRIDLAKDQLEQMIVETAQPAKQIARWLNLLADLQMKFANDLSGAQESLHRIQELLPRTAYAEQAQTRLALLKLETKGNEKSQTLKLGSYEKDLGLKKVTG